MPSSVVESWRRVSLRRRQKRTGGRLPSEVALSGFKFASLLKGSSVSARSRVEGWEEHRRDFGFRNVFRWHIDRGCLVVGGRDLDQCTSGPRRPFCLKPWLELMCREESHSLLSRLPIPFVRKFGSESPLSEDSWQAPERSCLE